MDSTPNSSTPTADAKPSKPFTRYVSPREKISKKNWKGSYTKVLIAYQRGYTPEQTRQFSGLATRMQRYVMESEYGKERYAELDRKITERVVLRSITDTNIEKTRELLTKAAYRAAITVRSLAKSGEGKDRVRLAAAQDILDRAGLKAIERVETHDRSYSPEELSSMLTTAKEIETIMMRLNNKDSRFLLKSTSRPAESVTERSLVYLTEKQVTPTLSPPLESPSSEQEPSSN